MLPYANVGNLLLMSINESGCRHVEAQPVSLTPMLSNPIHVSYIISIKGAAVVASIGGAGEPEPHASTPCLNPTTHMHACIYAQGGAGRWRAVQQLNPNP